jgi:hypothetical protein
MHDALTHRDHRILPWYHLQHRELSPTLGSQLGTQLTFQSLLRKSPGANNQRRLIHSNIPGFCSLVFGQPAGANGNGLPGVLPARAAAALGRVLK